MAQDPCPAPQLARLDAAEHSRRPGLFQCRQPRPARTQPAVASGAGPAGLGVLTVTWKPGVRQHQRPARLGRRFQHALQDDHDVGRALLVDLLEHPAVVPAVDLGPRGQGRALEHQVKQRLAGRAVRGHQVAGQLLGRQRDRDLQTTEPDRRRLHRACISAGPRVHGGSPITIPERPHPSSGPERCQGPRSTTT